MKKLTLQQKVAIASVLALVAGVVGLTASALALALLENEEFAIVKSALGRLFQDRSAVLAPSAEEPNQL